MARRRLYLLPVLLTFPSLVYSADPGKAAATEAKRPMLKAPFALEEAVAAQDKCGQELGVPVEITNSIGMKLKLIPAGEFMVGSPESDGAAFSREKRQRKVRISKPFYLGVTEVTQGRWKAVMGTEPWSGETLVKEGAEYAATHVSWEDAMEFCKRLSAKDGATYRLPTEAEWEYACRGGTTSVYHFGDDDSRLGEYAWFEDNADDIGEEYAHEVGQKKPNPFGLYDMHGNVWEWCSDRYDSDYYSESSGSDPRGPSDGSDRELAQLRQALPVGVPWQVRPVVPDQAPGLPRGPHPVWPVTNPTNAQHYLLTAIRP